MANVQFPSRKVLMAKLREVAGKMTAKELAEDMGFTGDELVKKFSEKYQALRKVIRDSAKKQASIAYDEAVKNDEHPTVNGEPATKQEFVTAKVEYVWSQFGLRGDRGRKAEDLGIDIGGIEA